MIQEGRFYRSATKCSESNFTMQKFYLGESSASSSETDLPYPQPLTRAAFLTPTFSPTTFLSSLHNRHQTLEDLRSELRTRSQELNKELLDLVNENYSDFLTLGSSLQGGEERVEEVRVGLLGFRRDVEGLKNKVQERRREVEEHLDQKIRMGKQIQLGRGLLEVEGRVRELETRLMVKNSDQEDGDQRSRSRSEHELNAETNVSENDGDGSEEDDEDEADSHLEPGVLSISQIKRHAERYMYIQKSVQRLGPQHPFLVRLQDRIIRLRQTVLLDLNNALKAAAAVQSAVPTGENNDQDKGRGLIKVLAIYRDIGEAEEALKILRERKRL